MESAGRVVRLVQGHAAVFDAILKDPQMSHVYFDVSWDDVAKYLTDTPESIKISADLINRYPDRFLFGTDEVAPSGPETNLKVYYQYAPLWKQLEKATSETIRKRHNERICDAASQRVRRWEAANVK